MKRYAPRVQGGPYRDAARARGEARRPLDHEALAIAALLAISGAIPVISDLAHGAALGAPATLGLLLVITALAMARAETRRHARARDNASLVSEPAATVEAWRARGAQAAQLAAALAIVGAATAIAWALRDHVDLADIAMIHLVALGLIAARLRLAISVAAAIVAVLSFDFFFVPPFFTFHVSDLRHVATFAVMLGGSVVLATTMDRLRRRTAEAEAERGRARTEEMRSSILSAVSHDLRTPLAVITGATTTLLDESSELDEAGRRELLRTVTEEAARLERLVANVLEMSRLESGAEVCEEWVPIEELVGSALTRCEERLAGREVRTALPETVVRVPVDPVLFEQVLINLLDNAAKHTPAGSPIAIEVHPEDGGLAIEVADRGPGIRGADGPRLFEKFQRSSSAAGGVGLGLAICRGIIEAHGGTIEALGREGGGARLRIVLPIFDRAEHLRPEEPPADDTMVGDSP